MENQRALNLLGKEVMHLILKTMMMVVSTKMTVKMLGQRVLKMRKMLVRIVKMRWIRHRLELVARHPVEVVNRKELREISWRTNHMIWLSMSMTLKKLSPTRRMMRCQTCMKLEGPPRPNQQHLWELNSSNNYQRSRHNFSLMKRMVVRRTRKCQEPIILPNLQTYKYLKK